MTHTAPESQTSIWDKIAEYRKGIAGLLVPGLTTLGLALLPTSDGGPAITASEWITVAIASLVTGSVVTAVSNRPQS